ncbi:MAG: PKD domain-containing protein, partial [Patescibacteria group bacterium]|nr:PKD domain-containing protein [Patescibacteria group bacterium]
TDGVRILNPESAVIDTLLYDSPNTNALPNDTGNPGEHFATDVPSGSSLARISGSDSNNCEEDFIQTDEPTPGEPNTVSPNAVFEISETIFKGTEVTLEGKESFDPDGEIKSWHWIIDHENIEIIEKEGELIEITFDQVGEASITLTVTDNDGLSSALTIETEVVNDPDNPDIIKISEVKTLDAKTIVTIIGTVTAPVPCLYEKETYIQDESGGIRVRITQDQKLEYDKTYQITGKLGTTYGENRIEAQQIRSIEQNTTISPYTININNISENNIGLLITTEAEVIKKRGNYIYLSMENNDTTLRLYFSKYSGLEAPDDTKGQTLKVTGVVSRYGTNSDGTAKIRIMPRFENDIAKTENHELLAVTGKDILSSITAAIVFPAAFTLLAVITARTQHQKTFSC